VLINIRKVLLTVCQTHGETRQCLDDATRLVMSLLGAFQRPLSEGKLVSLRLCC
jgi:hypothetical protein